MSQTVIRQGAASVARIESTTAAKASQNFSGLGTLLQPDVIPVKVPYFVHRTKPAMQLPVYSDFKFGKTQTFTTIRRIEGAGSALVEELRKKYPQWEIQFNVVNKHIKIKGNVGSAVRKFLAEKGF